MTEVKQVLSALAELGEQPSLEQITPLLAKLRAHNRQSHLAMVAQKEHVGEERAKVDTARLALQNLEYEKNMLEAEIRRCMEFKSIYKDIDLHPLDEFRAAKGEEPDAHTEMVNRFKFELEERQRLEAEKQELQAQKTAIIKQNREKKALLESAETQISKLLATTQSLESKFA